MEEDDHRAAEGFEIELGVDASAVFDVHEERHPEDGVDEHDEKEQQADVEQRGQRYSEGEEQRANSLRTFDETQYTSDSDDTSHTEQRRRYEILFNEVGKSKTW